MIAYLRGTVLDKALDRIVLGVQGVGYEVLVIPEDYNQLALNEAARLHIYEHIREASYDLYGFTQTTSKQFFQQLLGVNGVGPKVALAILGSGNSQTVKQAIAAGDTKLIQSAPGVGKRVAERIVIELKDKVGLVSSENATDFLHGTSVEDEAAQALVTLGYMPADAARALRDIDPTLSTEDRVKQALKGASS